MNRATPQAGLRWPGTDPERWKAVLARDLRHDGRFVYAVHSTGVYCRPSCPSRRPHPSQVVFYLTPAAAERAGFRACRRCHPRLFEELLEKRRMQEELKLAAGIQARLQPAAWPTVKGWEFAGASSACHDVGGDYYDCFERGKDGRVILALGDVAGKGADAALLMSSVHAAVRAHSRRGASVSEVMREVNHYICENTPAEKFVTLFYAEVDSASGRIRYSNAGHPPPLLIQSSGRVTQLDAGGIPLGILANAFYGEGQVVLRPGDVLVLYSDGIKEAMNERGTEFGEWRLAEMVWQNGTSSASQLRDRIGEALARFGGAVQPADDRTVMIVKRGASGRLEKHPALVSAGQRLAPTACEEFRE